MSKNYIEKHTILPLRKRKEKRLFLNITQHRQLSTRQCKANHKLGYDMVF